MFSLFGGGGSADEANLPQVEDEGLGASGLNSSTSGIVEEVMQKLADTKLQYEGMLNRASSRQLSRGVHADQRCFPSRRDNFCLEERQRYATSAVRRAESFDARPGPATAGFAIAEQ
jgi:hypothetical protein